MASSVSTLDVAFICVDTATTEPAARSLEQEIASVALGHFGWAHTTGAGEHGKSD
jgi:hypothetical protein